MSEHRTSHLQEVEIISAEVDERDAYLPPAQRHPKEREDEYIAIDEGTRLSAAQHRTANELQRLYQSLCGGQPGQYWPQALLDTAGRFNRPTFPVRGRK